MKCIVHLFILGLLPAGAWAQVEPISSGLDPRIRTIHYVADQPIRLDVPSDSMLAILLTPNERVQRATLRDAGTYQIAVAGKADSLFVRALGHSETVLSVATDRRSYEFHLRATDAAAAPYLVHFAQEASAAQIPMTAAQQPSNQGQGRYRVSGSKALRPVAIRDDGARTFIQWSGSQPMPAVFSLDDLGREEMVNGYMREGVFTIDRIHEQLVFRIDKAKARARRFVPEQPQ